MISYASLPIPELAALLRSRHLTSSALTRECLDTIHEKDPEIGAFLTVTEEKALADAEKADKRLQNGTPLSVLDGIPYAIKDNFLTAGIETTAASGMLSGFIPPCSATVVARLEKAGCVLVGKCNLDEFAMGSTTANSAYHVTKNPCNPAFVPGGSSGGSAACVAAGMAVFAIGSDTGGSVRLPAAFCGVTGLKPTYGAISRNGLVAFASSLDTVGILTRRPADCMIVCEQLSGKDPRDMTSGAPLLPDAYEGEAPILFLPVQYTWNAVSEETRALLSSATSVLRKKGYRIESVSLPETEDSLAAYEVLSSAEASSNLARYDGIRYGHSCKNPADPDSLYAGSRTEGFGKEVKRRILTGTYFLSDAAYDTYYRTADAARNAVRQALDRLLAGNTLLLCPSSPSGAFRFSEIPDAVTLRQTDLCLVPASLAGMPAIAVPCGTRSDGLPLSLQLVANTGCDRRLCRQAEQIFQLLDEVNHAHL